MSENIPFLGSSFLLQNAVAERLYHEHAKDLPIIDYHNHLPPDEIANNKTFRSITEVWLNGDHYKWRAMRANGIEENFITGTATDYEKFLKWSETVPYTMRNPLYHWTHLELKRYFKINQLLDASSAEGIYERTQELLKQDDYTSQGLLNVMNVEVICTTDNPTDTLEHHQKAKEEIPNIKVLPTFRPDKLILIGNPSFLSELKKLETIVHFEIKNAENLIAALSERIDYFANLGCKLADHGLLKLYPNKVDKRRLDDILSSALNERSISKEEKAEFQMGMLYHLAEIYFEREWTMQFHLGAIRNNNQRLMKSIGADVGCDSIGDYDQAEGLSYFLNALDKKEKLAKTILYNLNPRDNEVFATMAGNFNDGSIAGKIQWGSAWWFLDQKDGMEKQINALSNLGLLSRFIGMLTDSRSFLSFPRHEYFRRILCNLIGTDVVNGELPNDQKWLGTMIENICYRNAKQYFNF